MYKYVGRNGVLTTGLLIDGATKIDMLCLSADKGKILTNGEIKLYTVFVYLDEVDSWQEIDDIPDEDENAIGQD